MIVVFGFLFVTVSSRLTGEIGSSSNPISGMTVATLLLTCLVFVLLGWVGTEYRLAALSIAGIVCVAASNGGTTSQDLKTGLPRRGDAEVAADRDPGRGADLGDRHRVHAPAAQRGRARSSPSKAEYLPTVTADVAEPDRRPRPARREAVQGLVGRRRRCPGRSRASTWSTTRARPATWSTRRSTAGSRPATTARRSRKYEAPKARLMALIIDGIMKGKLPWGLVILGVLIAVLMQLSGVPALAFAVGVYLPLSTSMPIFVGGLVRVAVDRIRRTPRRGVGFEPGRAALQRLHRRGGDRRHPDRAAGPGARPTSRAHSTSPGSSRRPGTRAPGRRSGRSALMIAVLLLCGLGRLVQGGRPGRRSRRA